MSDVIYRLGTWRFGDYPIRKLKVVKRTAKTVTVTIDDYERPYNSRYALVSNDYRFFDTLKEAELVAENLVANRMQLSIARTAELRDRLQQVCRHSEINRHKKCHRCDFRVPNPEDYANGGG